MRTGSVRARRQDAARKTWRFGLVKADPNKTSRARLRMLLTQLSTGSVIVAAMLWLNQPVTAAMPAPVVAHRVVVTKHVVVTEVVTVSTYRVVVKADR